MGKHKGISHTNRALMDKQGTPEFEAECDRDERWAHELRDAIRAKVLRPFFEAHPEAGPEVMTGVLAVAAVHCMASLGCSPEEFGELAVGVAEACADEAKEVRVRIKGMGRA